MSNRKPVKLAAKVPISKRVVLVDGLARCGKGMTGRVLSHLVGGEHWGMTAGIENMVYLVWTGAVDADTAGPFLQLMINEQNYNRMLGRFLNTRTDDWSCIFACPDYPEYQRRSASEGGEAAIERFEREDRFFVYQTHNCMLEADFLFETFPWLKMVHIVRHPVVQAYKWHGRGWGVRDMIDPISSVPIIAEPEGVVPWFAKGWAGEFFAANPMERALEGVLRLQQGDEDGYAGLSDQSKNNVFRMSLDILVTDPLPVVEELAAFLDAEPRKQMEAMLLEERCPRDSETEEHRQMAGEIRESVSPERFERLRDASRAYEERWGVPRLVQ